MTFCDVSSVEKVLSHGNHDLDGKKVTRRYPDGTLKLTSGTNLRKKIVTFMWHSNDAFHYVSKAEFVTLTSLKVPSGRPVCTT